MLKLALTLLTIGIAIALAMRGWEFYALDITARVDHSDFRVLSPSEPVGHGYGVVGTLLMLTNLTYLLRRRFARLPVGSMRAWLDMHVFTGLLGSTLVLFHSAFQLRTPIAMVTSLSLAAVVLSGIIGRFLYALTPQVDGARFTRDLASLDELVSGLSDYLRRGLAALPAPTPASGGLVAALASIPQWRRQLLARRTVVREAIAAVGAGQTPQLQRELRRRARAVEGHARQAVNASLAEGVLRSWRGLHRFMAILMVLSVSVHIGVAWYFGFRWIFGE
jgi:hypothetical protein